MPSGDAGKPKTGLGVQMVANGREFRAAMMSTRDLQPPRLGPSADPVLYGVAAGLATLFPPVVLPRPAIDWAAGSGTVARDSDNPS